MRPEEIIAAALAGFGSTPDDYARGLASAETLQTEFADWGALAAALAVVWADARIVGISGGQGAGKSSLALAVVQAFAAQGRVADAVSLDDFYLTRAEREALAAKVHPLYATRGVPGTHDVVACDTILQAVSAIADGKSDPINVPVFDKGADDRSGWRPLPEDLDVLVLEGWCVGAPAEPVAALARPINDLERKDDPSGVWRGEVNACLAGPYSNLWRCLDGLVYLRVPDLAAVRRWRTQQEQSLPAEKRMSESEVVRFIEFYERLTLWMFKCMPERADLVVSLGDDHRIAQVQSG